MAGGFMQRFKGKILCGPGSLFSAGLGGATAAFQGTISKQFAAIASGGTSVLQTLMSYAMPLNTFNKNGNGIFVRCWGVQAGNANSKSLKLSVGGASFVSGSATQSGVSWEMSCLYLRSGASQQMAFFSATVGAVGAAKSAVSDTANDQAAITIAMQATATSASDITQNAMLVEFWQ